ncbi:neuroblastoma breakpoint family member 6-like protein, partial [Gorilla gorilla gorilla]|uniref:neuroblastoma breakpoint family member 6-like protein n=1 Tax=Gorilla gorilla gorilla TaxID=9595 RepID=UPI00300A70F4
LRCTFCAVEPLGLSWAVVGSWGGRAGGGEGKSKSWKRSRGVVNQTSRPPEGLVQTYRRDLLEVHIFIWDPFASAWRTLKISCSVGWIHDPLIQAQSEELTHSRQKIQEGRGVCYLFTQHVKNTVKSFEGLFRNTGIAYYQRQRFCEQMVQGSQLTEILVRKLATENHNGKKNEDRQKPLAPR